MRALGLDPVHGTRETFRTLCNAMSRPGTIQQTPNEPADYAVVATLVDHEVKTHTSDSTLQKTLSEQGRLQDAQPEDADIVHTHGAPSWDVGELDRGSLVEPSDGATVVYRVESVSNSTTDGSTSVTLSGPGISDATTVHIGLPAAELGSIRQAQSTYPRGIDVVFTVGDQIVAVPRSVSMEVA